MKANKFIVLGAGLLGLIAFFLPLIAVKGSGINVPISAFNIVAGVEVAQNAVKGEKDKLAGEGKAVAKDVDDALGAVKAIVLGAYAPALLCFLFGLIGVLKKSFGRGLGAGALLFGLIAFGIWLLLNTAANDAGAETGAGDVKGFGMWMMMLSALGCTVGGLMALIKPDRGEPAHPRHASTIKA